MTVHDGQVTGRGARVDARLQRVSRILVVLLPLWLVVGSAAADTAISLAGLMFLARSIMLRDWQWCRHGWFRVALLLWLWMLLSSLFAYDVWQSYRSCVPWFRFLLFVAAVEYWLFDRTWLRYLLYSAAVTVLLVSLDGLWQHFTGFDVFGHHYSEVRLTGPFTRPRIGIYLTKMLFPVTVGLYLCFALRGALWKRVVVAVAAALILLVVVLSGERMALILAGLGLLAMIVIASGRLRRDALIFAAGGALLVGGILLSEPQMLQRQVTSTVETLQHFGEEPYGQLWRRGLELGLAAPLTGQGVRTFKYACDDPAVGDPATVFCSSHPHQIYIEWFAYLGVVGLGGFVWFIVVIVRRYREVLSGPGRGGAVNFGPMIAVLIIFWPIATTGSFFSNWDESLFWFLLAWSLAAARQGQLTQTGAADG